MLLVGYGPGTRGKANGGWLQILYRLLREMTLEWPKNNASSRRVVGLQLTTLSVTALSNTYNMATKIIVALSVSWRRANRNPKCCSSTHDDCKAKFDILSIETNWTFPNTSPKQVFNRNSRSSHALYYRFPIFDIVGNWKSTNTAHTT